MVHVTSAKPSLRAWPLPPDENGYCYKHREHFDAVLYSAAQRLLRQHESWIERWRSWAIAGLMVIPAAGLLVLAFFSDFSSWLLIVAVVVMFGVLAWHLTRVGRFMRRILAERLCLGCGYRLSESPIAEQGWGVCPECGERFHACFYRQLPRRYVRPPTPHDA